ncbi:MAG: hypothetical protein ACREFY_00585 [Acetobacteraceae bacterium]
MKYVLPFETARRAVEISAVHGQLQVCTPYGEFMQLVKSLVAAVGVDESCHVERNDDVAGAIACGAMASVREYFVNDGYLEGRMLFPIAVHKQWYPEHNPDVTEGVRGGTILSAQAHFEENGYREGRRPSRL